MPGRIAVPESSTLQPTPRYAALALCTLLPAVASSIANVGLPAIAMAFDAPFDDVQWIVLAYLLAVTTAIVGAGRLGDLTGRRRLLLIGLAVFTGASLLCGLAPTLPLLIAARALQGLGAAVTLALTLPFVAVTTVASMGRAMGLLGSTSAIGTALGPVLGGALLAGIDWRAIFLIQVPLGLIAYALARRSLPADEPTPGGSARLDAIGTLLLAWTLGCYALAVTVEADQFGLLGAVLLLAALLGLGLFIIVERQVSSPLIPPGSFSDRRHATGLVTTALVSTVLMTTLVVGPFHLAMALGLSPVQLGLVMAVGPVIAALAGMPAGRASDRFGSDRIVLTGLIAVFAGCLALALMPESFGVPGYLAPLVVITAGYALFQAANNTAVMSGVEPDRRGVVSALLNLSRNLGLISGAAVMGAVFANISGDLGIASSSDVAAGTRGTFVAATVIVAVGLLLALCARRTNNATVDKSVSRH